MSEEKLGIEIQRPKNQGRASEYYGKHWYTLRYEFVIGKPKKSALDFVTTVDAQKVIAARKMNAGDRVGYMIFSVDPKQKLIEYSSIFPFDQSKKTYWEPLPFEGLGLASLIELQVLRDLNQKLPGFSITHDETVYEPRRKQYRNRGFLFLRKKVPLTKAIAMCRKQVQRNYFRHHPEKRPQKVRMHQKIGKLIRRAFRRKSKN